MPNIRNTHYAIRVSNHVSRNPTLNPQPRQPNHVPRNPPERLNARTPERLNAYRRGKSPFRKPSASTHRVW
jgi:hypothetical protein